jgi:hypothetical protein
MVNIEGDGFMVTKMGDCYSVKNQAIMYERDVNALTAGFMLHAVGPAT